MPHLIAIIRTHPSGTIEIHTTDRNTVVLTCIEPQENYGWPHASAAVEMTAVDTTSLIHALLLQLKHLKPIPNASA